MHIISLPHCLGTNIVYRFLCHTIQSLLKDRRHTKLPLHQISHQHHQIIGKSLIHEQIRLNIILSAAVTFHGRVDFLKEVLVQPIILHQHFARSRFFGQSQFTVLSRNFKQTFEVSYVRQEADISDTEVCGCLLYTSRIDDVKGFYKIVGGRAGVTEYYMYDATNLRLREVSLSYNFSRRWIQKTKVLKDVQLSFVARNLCFLYKKAPFDPDLVLSTGNDNQGIEVFGMPTTRSLGFTLKCEF